VPEGTIHLTHVYHLPFPGFLSNTDSEEQIRHAHRIELERLVPAKAAAAAQPAGDTAVCERQRFELHLIEGEVRAALRRQVAALGADLLVLGTQGSKGIAQAWLGSVAEEFLVRPPCDVLVVKRW
jgi:nucleotide-binding universal stress UspA family protein